jgi:hypothetical protein
VKAFFLFEWAVARVCNGVATIVARGWAMILRQPKTNGCRAWIIVFTLPTYFCPLPSVDEPSPETLVCRAESNRTVAASTASGLQQFTGLSSRN